MTTIESVRTDTATNDTRSRWQRVRQSNLFREFALVPAIILLLILGSVISPAFFTTANLVNNVLVTSAVLGVVVVAESIILISGYFDLSLESIVGFIPMLVAWLVVPAALGGSGVQLNPVVALIAGFVIAALIGLVNGFLVARLGLNAFIVTLAVLILLRGTTLGLSAGQTLTGLPDIFLVLGTFRILGVSIQVWLFVAIFVVAWLFMRNHPTGRKLYAMGGNSAAAEAAGIKTTRLTITVFVVGAVIAAFAGFMLMGRIASAVSNSGDGLIFTVFAAAVIGGISLNGGKGSLIGAFLGVIMLGIIENILTLSRVPSYWVQASYGAIILIALIVNHFTGVQERRRTV